MFALLFQLREQLNPPGLEEAEAVEQRNEDALLAEEPIAQFSMLYRPTFWWYEVYNTVRRLLLTCTILLFPTLGETTLFAVLVGTVTVVVEEKCKPHINSLLSAFCEACCWQILLFVLYLLLLDSRLTTGRQAVGISAVLMLANVCLIVTIFVDKTVQATWEGVVARSRLSLIFDHRLAKEEEESHGCGGGGGVELTDQRVGGGRGSALGAGFVAENPLHQRTGKAELACEAHAVEVDSKATKSGADTVSGTPRGVTFASGRGGDAAAEEASIDASEEVAVVVEVGAATSPARSVSTPQPSRSLGEGKSLGKHRHSRSMFHIETRPSSGGDEGGGRAAVEGAAEEVEKGRRPRAIVKKRSASITTMLMLFKLVSCEEAAAGPGGVEGALHSLRAGRRGAHRPRPPRPPPPHTTPA